MGQKCMDRVSSFLFEYDTPRMVLVRNKKVGLTFRLIQLIVLAYIIGWVFLYEKGYQSQDSIVSSVSVKLKGLTLTNESVLGPHIWDVVDYVFPPQGDNSFVVMTNFIVTPGQKQGTCPELPDAGLCTQDSDCSKGKYSRQGQGLMTGKCVRFNSTVKTCEIFGWCPVEVDYHVPSPALLSEAEKFTLFIKNSITFPKFKVSRRNLVESVTKQYLKKCTYHKVTDSLCPVFELGYIVKESGQNFTFLAVKGGVVGITIDWNCDLDWPLRYCKPIYQFHGLYNDDSNVSPGFNFSTWGHQIKQQELELQPAGSGRKTEAQRGQVPTAQLLRGFKEKVRSRYAKYYKEDGMEKRTLYKVFGIRLDILVNGKAGKFDIIPTMTTIGSGIGIFGVASVLCDLLLLHFLHGRDYYKQKKFKYAEQEPSKSHKKEKKPDNTQ
ncbi:P2X purinoceptor 1 isoform X1 [Anomalospiza imberbis]|uniref:P2X purinoceptor 1 isoform X1 n=1 Tax=Anomalospiza imberbis TaxID=187417 RepID=UPI00358F548C